MQANWKLRLRRWFLSGLRNLEFQIRMWLDEHDVCEVCKENTADDVCLCGRRICGECNSYYYEDETLCKTCRSEMTPEEVEADRIEARNEACESGCHDNPECPCRRPHTQHTEECRCICGDEPCKTETCAPSGYREPSEQEQLVQDLYERDSR